MSLKSRVEAVLFLTDKPVVAAVVAKLVNTDVQLVRQSILELIHDYEERNCALEIANDDDGYMMQVKDEYSNVANDLAPIDLPLAVVRTLSAIAIKQPVMQSDIVRIRGAGAYEHIKELLEKDLISKKEEGRSPLLSTTKKFQTYFRLSTDAKALRFQLKDNEKQELPVSEDQQLQIQDVQADGATALVPGDITADGTAAVEINPETTEINGDTTINTSSSLDPDHFLATTDLAENLSTEMIDENNTAESNLLENSTMEASALDEAVAIAPVANEAIFDDDYITAINKEPAAPEPAALETDASVQAEEIEEKIVAKASKPKAKKKVSAKNEADLADNIETGEVPTTFQPPDNMNAPDNTMPIIENKFSAAPIIN